ncbi:MAG: DEAD/DEAH box helicase family protein [SAR324 cluster bacterium]|nr:DEAD/DEAH box helicase family protein [SAR324 cluster bacterium]
MYASRYGSVLRSWFSQWGEVIFHGRKIAKSSAKNKKSKSKQKEIKSKSLPAKATVVVDKQDDFIASLKKQYDLLQPQTDIPIHFQFFLDGIPTIQEKEQASKEKYAWYHLRSKYYHLNLLKGFDELLCLPHLHNINIYWYQVETVRKVLKQFRGRVLLADEVGLGKTIEAGMVLKEYMLRGMVKRILILTPASLVGQWQEEMESKFGVLFETSYNSLLRTEPENFWKQEKVIASIASARRKEHLQYLKKQQFDLIIVDEAHHLKNRNTNNWKLVDALNKRFLLLLSATPVQNSLVELYNLLTLLKPGIFKTEKEFRSVYMTPGKPRIPANRTQMRDLMRDVMVRNTRSIVDVRLPDRNALMMRLDAGKEEAGCYQELSQLIQETHQQKNSKQRMALHHMLSAAGSSPVTAAAAIKRFVDKNKEDPRWHKLWKRYQLLNKGIKEHSLIELLQKNPDEKKMVFVHHRDTLFHLDQLLTEQKIQFTRFDGSMSGVEKDKAIECFREQVPVLLSTETGGEGRNIQFCNTIINFDLPWNPMMIEQRIGRIHRIGQTREVFIFNFAVLGTLEEQVLRILDEKINMFELVVGEIGAILGEMEEKEDFAEMVFNAWIEAGEKERVAHFDELGQRITDAKEQYESAKQLDDELFGEEFETA